MFPRVNLLPAIFFHSIAVVQGYFILFVLTQKTRGWVVIQGV